MSHFLPSLLTIAAALGAGWLIGVLFRRFSNDDQRLPRLRIGVQKLCLTVLNPLAFVGALWILPLRGGALLALPLVCILAQAGGFAGGVLATMLRPLPGAAQTIGFRISCSFTNTGNMGGLIVFLLLGEADYALVPVYKLFEEFWFYGVLFPYAREQAIRAGLLAPARRQRSLLLGVLADPFFGAVALAVALGLALNALGVERPAFYGALNSWLIPTSSFLLLMAVGSQIRVTRLARYWRPACAVALVRLAVMPALAFGALLAFGLAGDASVLRTVAVLSVMPMAFVSLVPASLYKLDADLIGAAWVVSSASLLLTVPLLSYWWR